MEFLTNLNAQINSVVWGVPMLLLLAGTGIFLSFRLRFVQFRKFGFMLQQTIGQIFVKKEVKNGALTPIQAMTTALAGTIGTGSIAGVAGAIAIGGPGAIFWMWVAALFGMCTKFCEITLAVRYRERNISGEYIGGPMYYIKNGLGQKWAWLGSAFCFFAIFASMGIGNMTQINTIATSVGSIFSSFDPAITGGQLQLIYCVIGLITAGLLALVLFGGLNRIGAVTEKLVPVMAVLYMICALIIVFSHANVMGRVFSLIFQGAFNTSAVGGGMTGVAILQVIRSGFGRGVFCNEAGLGTAPIAHASANVDHPVRQGLFGIFEVFITTFVICTLTALAILCSGFAEGFYGKTAGTDLTIMAFSSTMGAQIASIVVALSITMFAFSTILGWSLYGCRCMEYLFGTRSIKYYQIVFIIFVVIGANMELSLVWQISDNLNALMAIPNLIAIAALSPEVVRLTRDFFSRSDKPETLENGPRETEARDEKTA